MIQTCAALCVPGIEIHRLKASLFYKMAFLRNKQGIAGGITTSQARGLCKDATFSAPRTCPPLPRISVYSGSKCAILSRQRFSRDIPDDYNFLGCLQRWPQSITRSRVLQRHSLWCTTRWEPTLRRSHRRLSFHRWLRCN